MKVRMGFVSNSSSSSFVIRLDNINDEQIEDILKYSESEKCKDEDSEWSIEVSKKAGIMYGHNSETYGSDLFDHMKKIGVDMDKLFMGDY